MKYDHKNRKKIIWFNPPFCRLASINVDEYFLKLIDKHFKHDNILYNIYIYNSKQNECNCKTQNNCPMNGLYNLNNVVYQGFIYPKENIKDKKNLHWNFLHEMEN